MICILQEEEVKRVAEPVSCLALNCFDYSHCPSVYMYLTSGDVPELKQLTGVTNNNFLIFESESQNMHQVLIYTELSKLREDLSWPLKTKLF